MREELELKFIKAFPTIFKDRYGDMRETAMVWGIEVGDGWFDLLWRLCEKLEPLCAAAQATLTPDMTKFGYSCCASQIKEKYGTLRFYLTMSDDEMEALIREAKKESARTCETCGKLGELKDENGWLRTACEEH